MADNKNKKIAQEILPLVGGKENIVQARHCMTRLRLTLKDDSKADIEGLKALSGVVGCQFSGGQLQVIIGTNVGKVYDEFIALSGVVAHGAVEETADEPQEKKSFIDNLFGYISGSMTPVLPALIAAGLIKTVLAVFGPDLLGVITEDSNLYTYLTFLGDAGMYFLPIFLAVGAARTLKTSWAMAVYLAAVMLHPTFVQLATDGVDFTIFGIPCSVQNYSSTFMPIMLSVWAMSYVERFFRKHIPDALQVLAVPFCTIMIMTPVALCVLGPIGSFCSTYICNAITGLYNVVGPLATMLVGGLFLPLVFTGMHSMFYVYLYATFPTLGYDAFFLPGVVASSWAIGGAFLACMVRFKKKENKSFAASSFVTWLIGGVGEPFMYGVLIRNRKMLVASCAGGAIAGLVAGLVNLTANVLAPSNGVYGLFAFVGGSVWNYAALVITIGVGIATTFILCMILKVDDSDM